MMKYMKNMSSIPFVLKALWICLAVYMGIRLEEAYLNWFGTTFAQDEDHVMRFFVIAFAVSLLGFLPSRVPQKNV